MNEASFLVQTNPARMQQKIIISQQISSFKGHQEARVASGDALYIRVNVERRGQTADELPLRVNDTVYVDNTVSHLEAYHHTKLKLQLFGGKRGWWRAWLLDQDGRQRTCGIIPSKQKIEEEFALKRDMNLTQAEILAALPENGSEGWLPTLLKNAAEPNISVRWWQPPWHHSTIAQDTPALLQARSEQWCRHSNGAAQSHTVEGVLHC